MYFDKAAIAKDTEVNASRWQSKMKAESQQGFDPLGMTRGQGVDVKVVTTDGVPPYAEYVAGFTTYINGRVSSTHEYYEGEIVR